MIEPSRLLAGRRGLSRPEKDAILEAVLAATAPRRSAWRWPVLAVGALAAAGTLAVAVWPSARPSVDELVARGGGAVAPGFTLSCVPAPCAAGAKLVFDVTAPGDARYFSAFARRGDSWIWYFPRGPDQRSVEIPRGGGLLDLGIVLGPEHVPDEYAVVGVLSAEPLDRAAVRAAVERGDAILRPLRVAP